MTRLALPDLADSGPEIRWLVAQRLGENGSARKVVSTVTADAEQELADAIATEELDDLLGAVRPRKQSTHRSDAQHIAAEAPPPAPPTTPHPQSSSTSAAASSSSALAPSDLPRLIDPRPRDGAAFTLEDAKELLPRAPGCGAAIHSGRAWQVKYTGRVSAGPKSRMGTYGGREGLSFNTALKVCLQWAWDRHVEAHPDAHCPINWAAFPR
eukprot:2412642-Amphidinium_carterae.1